MKALRIIGFIAAGIIIFFGVIFILGAFSPQGSPSWIITGIIIVLIGFGIILLVSRFKPPEKTDSQVILNIDLPGNVDLDTLNCKTCGGVITSENIEMVAGAPVVTCPYCGTVYQLTEEPKW